jgi:hypothetical protein
VTSVTIKAARQLIWQENQVNYFNNSLEFIERDVETAMSPRCIGLTAGSYLIACALLSNFACAQSPPPGPAQIDTKPIGKVMSITGIAHIEHSAAVVVQANLSTVDTPTKIGDLVYRGDVIQTGADSALSITFADATSFNVSSNAKMEVNDFIYDPNGHSNSSLMSLTKGTFTFIAGNVAHTGDMKVNTPVGTMGIRGTAPRVEIEDDGTVKFSTLVEQK